jgi:predicted ATPase
LREGLAGHGGVTLLQCYGIAWLANALTRRGEHHAALAVLSDGLTAVEKTGHRRWESELHRVKAVALVGLNRLEEGQSALEEAIRIARRQQAKAYELRAATSLARLWGVQGRRLEASDLLTPVYGSFVEGFNTADLKEARSLLDALASSRADSRE